MRKKGSLCRQPLGIFDSGTGGLTITKAVVDLLPHEKIIYFGDTAHLPYGDKSAAAIKNYTLKIADMLLEHDCKLLLVACNSISAAAYETLQEYVDGKALLINVIDPLVEYLEHEYKNKTIGLIGTRQTVKSNIYHKKLAATTANITLRSLATPLLVPIIEEGFFDHQLVDLALSEYLSREVLQGIDALVLGCTHYPIIKSNIEKYYQNKVKVIDTAAIVAAKVALFLDQFGLLSDSRAIAAKKFYISDYTEAFGICAKMFFGKDVKLEYYPLWNIAN